METQTSELEAEAARLLRALEVEKTARTESERVQQRKVEEITREMSAQVNLVVYSHQSDVSPILTFGDLSLRRPWSSNTARAA